MRKVFSAAYYKRYMRAGIAIGLIGISLPGCSFFLGKEEKVETTRALTVGETECLKDATTTIADYRAGRASIEKVEVILDCAIRAVDSFTSRTRGASSREGYTLDEIHSFVVEYFDKKDEFASRLLQIAFEIKSTAVGGRTSNVTRAEIEKAKALILEIKKGLRELDPHMDLLLGRISKKETLHVEPARVEAAAKALEKFAERISEKVKSSDGTAIPISRLVELANSLKSEETDGDKEQKAKSEEDESKGGQLNVTSELVSSVKSILISGARDKIRCEEWPAVLKAMSKLYGVMLRQKYVLSGRTVGEPLTAKAVETSAHELLSILQNALNRHENQLIPLSKWRELIAAYESAKGALPMKIKSSSLETLLPKIFTHVLRPSRLTNYPNNESSEARRDVGLGTVELTALKYYVTNWLAGQEQARKLLAGAASKPASELLNQIQSDYRNYDPKTPEGQKRLSTEKGRAEKVVLFEFGKILDSRYRPLLHFNVNRGTEKAPLPAPIIRSTKVDAQYGLRELLALNSTRLTVEVVLRSFTTDIRRARELRGLTKDEAEILYKDARKIGFDIGVSDPRSQKAGHRTFMEANLFMSNSDGDEYIDYREGVEWYTYVSASGPHAMEILGNARAEYIASYKQQHGKEPQVLTDLFGQQKVDIGIFRQHLKSNFSKYFSNLPGMSRFVQSLIAQNKYQEFEVALENAARPIGHYHTMLESSAMRTLVPIIYYTESIFTLYDKNQSGILENDEAWAIFPLMQNTIRDISKGAAKTEKLQQMVFAKLLMSGEPPPDDWTKYYDIPIESLKEWWNKPSIDRLGIVKLIGAIATTGRNNSLKEIKNLFDLHRANLASEFKAGSVVILDQLHDISRCSPGSLEIFRKVMQNHANSIFAPANGQKLDSEIFVRRLQTIIQRHRVLNSEGQVVPAKSLSEQCLPMMRL